MAAEQNMPNNQNPINNVKKGEIEIDKFRLCYSIEGAGQPVLVIGSAVYYPRTFSQQLRKQLQLIFIDHRGFAIGPPSYNQSNLPRASNTGLSNVSNPLVISISRNTVPQR